MFLNSNYFLIVKMSTTSIVPKLERLLEGVEREHSLLTEEYERFDQNFERRNNALVQLAMGIEDLMGTPKSQLKGQTSSRDNSQKPRKLIDYDDEIPERVQRSNGTGVRHVPVLPRSEYDEHRANIEGLIFDYYKNNPMKPRTHLTIHDFYKIPGVSSEVRKREHALRKYLGSIRKKNSGLKYNSTTQTWSVEIRDKYDRIAKAAVSVLKKYRYVTVNKVTQKSGVGRQDVNIYLPKWAAHLRLTAETDRLKEGRSYRQVIVYR
jgi:hypothetical protein